MTIALAEDTARSTTETLATSFWSDELLERRLELPCCFFGLELPDTTRSIRGRAAVLHTTRVFQFAITLELLGQFLRFLDQNDRHSLGILLIY